LGTPKPAMTAARNKKRNSTSVYPDNDHMYKKETEVEFNYTGLI
jgi:hypothetical protein